MNSFLYRVAEAFLNKYQEKITDFTFVFPNRRAGLFFQKYITKIIEKPIFAPEITTINDCFFAASDLQVVDKISALFRLYNIYIAQSQSKESFDDFIFWGEMMLVDFDDADRYLTDTKQLFHNVKDYKEIDNIFEVLTDKQKAIIKQFWANFETTNKKDMIKNFQTVWKYLLPVYLQFRQELIDDHLGTEAMIFRSVAEKLKNNVQIDFFENNNFVFIGFNALNPCEKALLNELQKLGKADFYWDYASKPLQDKDNPASKYFRENTTSYPSKLKIQEVEDNFYNKDIQLISAPSAVGQAKLIHEILKKEPHKTEQTWTNTAIVLPDENLLIPLLHSLPEEIDKINITMGLPLKSTPIAGLIDQIFELQQRKRKSDNKQNYYYKSVTGILHHQYIDFLFRDKVVQITKEIIKNNLIYVESNIFADNELLSLIFTSKDEVFNDTQYLSEILRTLLKYWLDLAKENKSYLLEADFIYQYYITINRLGDLLKNQTSPIALSPNTLIKLIKQLTSNLSVPFIGEPLDGLQIMGILENRGLDFENLIISSFNEGIFPKSSHSNSYIPYNLRKAFGLPTFEEQDEILSYNFYRLIHRAKRIVLLYDSRNDMVKTGEVSRYIHQLEYHYGVKIEKKALEYKISISDRKPLRIEKTPAIMEKLSLFTSTGEKKRHLSASSLNTYINCPLQFYLSKVESIDETDEIQDIIESNTFGSIFHFAVFNLYNNFVRKTVNKTDLEDIIQNKALIKLQIKRGIAKEYFKRKADDNIAIEGNLLLISNIIEKYIVRLLRYDITRTPFEYVEGEKEVEYQFPINNAQVNFKGFIDRIDIKDGSIYIIDYKTGSGDLSFKSLDEVFDTENSKRPQYVLQTFLYGILYKKYADKMPMVPSIYYVRNLYSDSFGILLQQKMEKKQNKTVVDFSDYEAEFSGKLKACLNDLFDPEIPFEQVQNIESCKYCQFKNICKR